MHSSHCSLIHISQAQGLPRMSKGQATLHLLSSTPLHCCWFSPRAAPPFPLSKLFCASTFLSTLPSPSNICFLHPCSRAQECLWQKPVTRMTFPTTNLFFPLLVSPQQNTSPNTNNLLDCNLQWPQFRSLPFSVSLFTAQDRDNLSKEARQRMTWSSSYQLTLAFAHYPQVSSI